MSPAIPQHRYLLCLLILATPILAGAGEQSSAGAPKMGRFQTTFKERSPDSSLRVIAKRMGMPMETVERAPTGTDYNLADESFDVFIPKSYTADRKHGLLVWVSPGDTTGLPPAWFEVLEKHGIIWISANRAGNEQPAWRRFALHVDAAHNMSRQFAIDPRRVYISGMSGGGRVASMLAIGYPDLFRGGYYVCGCNFYRNVRTGDGLGVYRRSFVRVESRALDEARQYSRYVFLTGETDGNRDQTKVYEEAYRSDGFRHTLYIEVPGMGHALPGAGPFEEGIEFLDSNLGQPTSVPTVVTSPREGAAEPAAKPQEESERLLRLARLHIQNHLYTQARTRLEKIVDDYPQTSAAQEARKLLAEIADKQEKR